MERGPVPIKDKCLLYLRLSNQQEDSESIKRQRSLGLAYARAHKLTPAVVEEEAGHRSGLSEKARPGWRQVKDWLLTRADLHTFWVAELSRATRDTVETIWLLSTLQQRDIHFVSQSEPDIRIDTAEDEFLSTMRGAINKMEARRTARRQKNAISYFKSQGGVWGHAPAGLKPEGKGPHRRYVASDETYTVDGKTRTFLETVEAWFRLYTAPQGIGIFVAASQLQAEGFRWQTFRKGRGPVTVKPQNLADILTVAEYYREALGDELIDAVLRRRQERAGRKENGRRMVHPILPLNRLLRCAHCSATYWQGGSYRGTTDGRVFHPYYQHAFPTCAHTSVISAHNASRALYKFLEPLTNLPAAGLEAAAKRAVAALARPSPRRQTARDKKLAALRAQLEAAGVSDELQAQVLGELITANLPDPAPAPSPAVPTVPQLVATMRQAAELLTDPDADPALVNRTLRALLDHVDVDGQKLHFFPRPWVKPFLKRR